MYFMALYFQYNMVILLSQVYFLGGINSACGEIINQKFVSEQDS